MINYMAKGISNIKSSNEKIEILPIQPANAGIIWLHGLGASGEDFLPIIDQLKLDPKIHVKWIFPHAPIRPITINNYMQMRAWYDIANFNELINNFNTTNQQANHAGLDQSSLLINNLIINEIQAGIPAKNILLAGFSQGGALALHTSLRFNLPLGGVICLSGYLPWPQLLASQQATANQGIKVFIAHGKLDPIIPFRFAKISCQTLIDLGYNVTWRSYQMLHTVIDQEILDLEKFMHQVISVS